MNYEYIRVTKEDGVLTLILNRPDKLNALFGNMRSDLADIVERAADDDDVRVVVITGAGRAFCAGADVRYMAELIERDEVELFARLLGAARRALLAIRSIDKPVIASINGLAYGAGFNLALACDIRVAVESATFSQSFIKVGLHPDWGGTYMLPRAVPANIACELFFLGDEISAQQALRMNLLNRMVPDEELSIQTRRWATRLANAPKTALGLIKRAVYMSGSADLEQMVQYETDAQLACFKSQEARERILAFVNKRDIRN